MPGARMATVLTAQGVLRVKPDPAKRIEIPDAVVPGLYSIVQPSGVKSWAVRYRHRGIAVNVIEAVLNHTGGEISGVTAVYNRHKYFAEKRRALDAWAGHVMQLVGEPATSNIISFRG